MKKIFFLIILILAQYSSLYGKSSTASVWETTGEIFVNGRLKNDTVNLKIAPGWRWTIDSSINLSVNSYQGFINTFTRAPEVGEKIYQSGIIQNYIDYKRMALNNWKFAKLSKNDFIDAREVYILEGNWGLVQTTYYCLKGTSRVIWALGILNSSEAIYKTGEAIAETVYYTVEYPAKGIGYFVLMPVVFVGGGVWSTGATVISTGWAFPFTLLIDFFSL